MVAFNFYMLYLYITRCEKLKLRTKKKNHREMAARPHSCIMVRGFPRRGGVLRAAASNRHARDHHVGRTQQLRRLTGQSAAPSGRSMLIAVNRHVQGDRQPCDLESPMRSQRGGGGRARFDREQMPRPSPPEVVVSASWRCRAWFRPLCRHADARPASAVRDQAGDLSGQIAL